MAFCQGFVCMLYIEGEGVVYMYICVYVTYLLYIHLSLRLLPGNIQPDSKLHADLWSIQKKVPFIVLHYNSLWYTGEFLRDVTPYVLKKPDPLEPEVCRRAYMSAAAGQFGVKVSAYLVQANAWFLAMDTKVTTSWRFNEGL